MTRGYSSKERGSGAAGLAGMMFAFGVVYFIFYFIVTWIYDTKESRKDPHFKNRVELRVITEEEVMKRGIGQHVFKCYGIFTKTCHATELYRPTA